MSESLQRGIFGWTVVPSIVACVASSMLFCTCVGVLPLACNVSTLFFTCASLVLSIITVVSGEGLVAKDANGKRPHLASQVNTYSYKLHDSHVENLLICLVAGKSDPYCKMAILPRKHQDSQQV